MAPAADEAGVSTGGGSLYSSSSLLLLLLVDSMILVTHAPVGGFSKQTLNCRIAAPNRSKSFLCSAPRWIRARLRYSKECLVLVYISLDCQWRCCSSDIIVSLVVSVVSHKCGSETRERKFLLAVHKLLQYHTILLPQSVRTGYPSVRLPVRLKSPPYGYSIAKRSRNKFLVFESSISILPYTTQPSLHHLNLFRCNTSEKNE